MREKIRHIIMSLRPYKDVVLFMVALLCAHFFWKFTVDAEELDRDIYWFGMDISLPFNFMSEHIARVVYRLIGLSRDTIHYVAPESLRFDSGTGSIIVWGCTGLKQSFIWLVIMMFSGGSWSRKLWFVPLGWLCIYVFNIIRITLITLAIEFHPDWFEFLHSYLFKYMFYFMLFMLWVWWTERIGKAKK
ncbi:MAG: exosortase/archaeosortase family protein [Paludibacter sp.]|nr:exosortase/archaeosortase family protein [Bacteroides sp.]MCM1443074.1 exosortase/archaeosortase family protein [Muribaculum sp.]MCM1482261.1 exosortase/archaeosortase family protein [Paludibacter sp.]